MTKRLILIALFCAVVLRPARPMTAAAPRTDKRLIGAWLLASLEEPDANGALHTADCTGQLVFTADGHMSVQVMYRTPATDDTPNPKTPVQYAQGGYEASFGRYQTDSAARTFTLHVEGALVRTLVGQDLSRKYEFPNNSNNQLVVTPSNPNEHWRVTWERP